MSSLARMYVIVHVCVCTRHSSSFSYVFKPCNTIYREGLETQVFLKQKCHFWAPLGCSERPFFVMFDVKILEDRYKNNLSDRRITTPLRYALPPRGDP
jgi:hypothetical protein